MKHAPAIAGGLHAVYLLWTGRKVWSALLNR
jgi:hypothetical protein